MLFGLARDAATGCGKRSALRIVRLEREQRTRTRHVHAARHHSQNSQTSNTNTHAHTLPLAPLLRQRARIHNKRRNFRFSQCAVSAREICLILICPVTYYDGVLGLYDLNGAQLHSLSVDANSYNLTHCLSNLRLDSRSRFALLEQADKHEVALVFKMVTWGLKYVRVRSSVNGCGWRRGAIELARDGDDGAVEGGESAAVRQAQSTHIALHVHRQPLLDRRSPSNC